MPPGNTNSKNHKYKDKKGKVLLVQTTKEQGRVIRTNDLNRAKDLACSLYRSIILFNFYVTTNNEFIILTFMECIWLCLFFSFLFFINLTETLQPFFPIVLVEKGG